LTLRLGSHSCVRYIACDSHRDLTSFLCKSHANSVQCDFSHILCYQGRTDHLGTWALPEGPGVSRGPHEMPLLPFRGCFGCGLSVGKDTGAP
ncbi:unnamed protein product, partial [Staurois parvus]